MTKDGRRAMKCPQCDGSGISGTDYWGEANTCPYCKDGLIWSDDVIRLRDRFEDAVTTLRVAAYFYESGDMARVAEEIGARIECTDTVEAGAGI